MSLIALGINHKTAPLSLRERVAFSSGSLGGALAALAEIGISEAVILSTCNRTELFCQAPMADGRALLTQWLADFHRIDQATLNDALYFFEGEPCVTHLMKVACGLDSMVLGEPQILGQLKQAFFEGRDTGMVGSMFHRLFDSVFSAAKRIRSETDIGANAVSVAFSAVSLARHIFADLKSSRVLLIGAGETIELVARHLVEQGASQIMVANRTEQRAKQLAQQFDASVLYLSDIPSVLASADIVISSTGSPLPLIGKGMVESALRTRKYRPMLLIDLAVPRDIEEQVNTLGDAYLYSVDDLQMLVEQNIAQRQKAAELAEQMITEEVAAFVAWQNGQQGVNLLRRYREQSESVRDELVKRALQQIENGSDPNLVLSELGHRLTSRLIHSPTRALDEASRAGEFERLELLAKSLGVADSE